MTLTKTETTVVALVPDRRRAALVCVHAAWVNGDVVLVDRAVMQLDLDEFVPDEEAARKFDRRLAEVARHCGVVNDVVVEQVPYSQRDSRERASLTRARQMEATHRKFPKAHQRPIPAWIWRARFHLSRGSGPGLIKLRIEADSGLTFETEELAMAYGMAAWAAEDTLVRAAIPSVRDMNVEEQQ